MIDLFTWRRLFVIAAGISLFGGIRIQLFTWTTFPRVNSLLVHRNCINVYSGLARFLYFWLIRKDGFGDGSLEFCDMIEFRVNVFKSRRSHRLSWCRFYGVGCAAVLFRSFDHPFEEGGDVYLRVLEHVDGCFSILYEFIVD